MPGFEVTLKDVMYKPDGVDRPVLAIPSLTIEGGQFVAIVGRNAAGKSSLLRAIAGELEYESSVFMGQVLVGGQQIDMPTSRIIDGVGIVHQFDSVDLVDEYTVAENIAIRQVLGGGHTNTVWGITPRWKRRIAEAIGSSGIQDGRVDLDDLVKPMAGGMRQLLSIAIAAHLEHERNPCRLLLLDEHTSRLDETNARAVMDFTSRTIDATGATAIMVTHRLPDAVTACKRILVVQDGRIVADMQNENYSCRVEDLSGVINTVV